MPAAVWTTRFADRLASAAEAVADVRSGQRVFIGSGAAEPQTLVRALAERGTALADTEVVHLLTLGVAPYVDPRLERGFRHNAFFIGANVREAVAECRADYTPVFLSELPALLRSRRLPLDVALVQVSPPDEHGYVSLGVSVDVVKAAAESATRVVAQVNPRMPRTLGDSFLHASRFDALVDAEDELLEADHGAPDEVARRIGEHVARLIEDGSTLQMGIGTIPDAVLAALDGQRDLGVHTEMFSDGVIDLVERGMVNGSRKSLHRGKIVTSFVLGTRRLYDWVDDNPLIEFHPSEYTNDPFLIARHERMVAINSALQIDLTGQVCADSLGTFFYSGIGGQVDFIRGAARSPGGKAIIALPSTAAKGKVSRIAAMLQPGAGVVTSRGDVHWVVTEFGAVDLHGKTVRDRALALIHIAHPDFRDELMARARERKLVPADQVAVLGIGTDAVESLRTVYTTRDGRELVIRPVRPTDEGMLKEAFYSLSAESKHQRFLAAVEHLDREDLLRYAGADHEQDVALVARWRGAAGDELVAGARYLVDPSTGEAELAFTVRDAWQGQGIGSYLFERLVEIGRKRGITTFTADVRADNAAMLKVFHEHAPAAVESHLEDGVQHLRIPLE